MRRKDLNRAVAAAIEAAFEDDEKPRRRRISGVRAIAVGAALVAGARVAASNAPGLPPGAARIPDLVRDRLTERGWLDGAEPEPEEDEEFDEDVDEEVDEDVDQEVDEDLDAEAADESDTPDVISLLNHSSRPPVLAGSRGRRADRIRPAERPPSRPRENAERN